MGVRLSQSDIFGSYIIVFVIRRLIFASCLTVFPQLPFQTASSQMTFLIILNLMYTAYTIHCRPYLDKQTTRLEVFNEFCNLQVSVQFLILVSYQNRPAYLNDLGITINWFLIFVILINVCVVGGGQVYIQYKKCVLNKRRKEHIAYTKTALYK